MKIKTALQAAGLKKVYDYIDKDPHARLPQVVSLIEKFVPPAAASTARSRASRKGSPTPATTGTDL